MKIQQTLIFAIAAVIFAALQPARANSQGASAPSDVHVAYSLRPTAQDANETSHEEEARPVMSKLLPDFPGKKVVIMTVTYPPGHFGAVHRHNAHGFIYVLESSVDMAVNGGVPVTVPTGQTFYKGLTTFIPSAATPARRALPNFWCGLSRFEMSNASFIRGKTAAHREVSHGALFSTAFEVGKSNAF